MIRLAVVTVLLAVAVVVVKRRQARATGTDVLRVASRTAISRGVMAAVIEVEQRRFLVTITPTSTTLVAELGPTGLPLTPAHALDAAFGPARPAAPTPDAAPLPVPAFASVTSAPVAPVPAAPATPAAAAAPAADGGFLDRLRARTVRAYDPELVAALRGER